MRFPHTPKNYVLFPLHGAPFPSTGTGGFHPLPLPLTFRWSEIRRLPFVASPLPPGTRLFPAGSTLISLPGKRSAHSPTCLLSPIPLGHSSPSSQAPLFPLLPPPARFFRTFFSFSPPLRKMAPPPLLAIPPQAFDRCNPHYKLLFPALQITQILFQSADLIGKLFKNSSERALGFPCKRGSPSGQSSEETYLPKHSEP